MGKLHRTDEATACTLSGVVSEARYGSPGTGCNIDHAKFMHRGGDFPSEDSKSSCVDINSWVILGDIHQNTRAQRWELLGLPLFLGICLCEFGTFSFCLCRTFATLPCYPNLAHKDRRETMGHTTYPLHYAGDTAGQLTVSAFWV